MTWHYTAGKPVYVLVQHQHLSTSQSQTIIASTTLHIIYQHLWLYHPREKKILNNIIPILRMVSSSSFKLHQEIAFIGKETKEQQKTNASSSESTKIIIIPYLKPRNSVLIKCHRKMHWVRGSIFLFSVKPVSRKRNVVHFSFPGKFCYDSGNASHGKKNISPHSTIFSQRI